MHLDKLSYNIAGTFSDGSRYWLIFTATVTKASFRITRTLRAVYLPCGCPAQTSLLRSCLDVTRVDAMKTRAQLKPNTR